MKFFKKELCIKLQKLGCVTRSGFLYISSNDKIQLMAEGEDVNAYFSLKEIAKITEKTPAFTIYDFLSDEGYAEENCFKVIKKNSEETPQLKMFNLARLAEFKSELVFAKNQEAYIEKAVDRVIKENNNG